MQFFDPCKWLFPIWVRDHQPTEYVLKFSLHCTIFARNRRTRLNPLRYRILFKNNWETIYEVINTKKMTNQIFSHPSIVRIKVGQKFYQQMISIIEVGIYIIKPKNFNIYICTMCDKGILNSCGWLQHRERFLLYNLELYSKSVYPSVCLSVLFVFSFSSNYRF